MEPIDWKFYNNEITFKKYLKVYKFKVLRILIIEEIYCQ